MTARSDRDGTDVFVDDTVIHLQVPTRDLKLTFDPIPGGFAWMAVWLAVCERQDPRARSGMGQLRPLVVGARSHVVRSLRGGRSRRRQVLTRPGRHQRQVFWRWHQRSCRPGPCGNKFGGGRHVPISVHAVATWPRARRHVGVARADTKRPTGGGSAPGSATSRLDGFCRPSRVVVVRVSRT